MFVWLNSMKYHCALRNLSLVSGFGRLAPGLFPEAAADL
jgi:hypothetical protein